MMKDIQGVLFQRRECMGTGYPRNCKHLTANNLQTTSNKRTNCFYFFQVFDLDKIRQGT